MTKDFLLLSLAILYCVGGTAQRAFAAQEATKVVSQAAATAHAPETESLSPSEAQIKQCEADCIRNYSTNPQELESCLLQCKKNVDHHDSQEEGKVALDPAEASIDTPQGKSKW